MSKKYDPNDPKQNPNHPEAYLHFPISPDRSRSRIRKRRGENRQFINELIGKKQEGVLLGQDMRGKGEIYLTDRFRHLYVLGKSGYGKSNLFQHLITQDMETGAGVGVLAKEHQQMIKEVLPFVPRERVDDVVYFNPLTENPLCVNPLQVPDGEKLDSHVQDLTQLLQAIMPADVKGVYLPPLLKYTLRALCQYEGTSLLQIAKFLNRKDKYGFRADVLQAIDDEQCREYFFDQFPVIPNNMEQSIINRFNELTTNSIMRKALCGRTTFHVEQAINESKILLFNVSDAKDVLGKELSAILGSFFVAKVESAVFNRQSLIDKGIEAPPFYFYIDEFATFISDPKDADSYNQFLIRARKNMMGLHIAHQGTSGIPANLLSVVKQTVTTRMFFQIDYEDAVKFCRGMRIDTDEGPATLEPHELTGQSIGTCWVVTNVRNAPYVTQISTPRFTKSPDKKIRDLIIQNSDVPQPEVPTQPHPDASQIDSEPHKPTEPSQPASEHVDDLWDDSEPEF